MTRPDSRRGGDTRPFHHNPEVSLTLKPAPNEPFRWLPKHGEPLSVGEWFTQRVVQALAYLPVYTAIIATLTLVAVLLAR